MRKGKLGDQTGVMMPISSLVRPRPRGRIPTDELARREEEFLDAATSLFREHGFARVSIDMIARSARISPKTIYARFGGKNGLFTAVIRKMVAPVLATQDLLDKQQADEPIAVLRKVASQFLDRILEPELLDLHRMMVAEATHMPELARLYYVEGYDKALSRLAKWLAEQHAAGRLHVPNPHRASAIFIGIVNAGIHDRALLLNEVPTAEERASSIEDALKFFDRASTRSENS
ncbi:MAG: TetR/AcrR family transcriptional regulator [Bradyrhizobiaceae bacterium]|jgi:TetR/AcrR family transcriptional regulator, mexJK operon transcriptional repressor|nr:MAG: TetR/AcrR family transcriptional regulator [Bradyrhizobiaceae bacterium]